MSAPGPAAVERLRAERARRGFHPWHLLRHDIGRKLTAVALAVGLWYGLEYYVTGDRVFDLDVRLASSRADADLQRNVASAVYLIVPSDVIVRSSTSPRRVSVRVKGLRSELEGLELSALLEIDPEVLGERDEHTVELLLDRAVFKTRGREPDFSEFSVTPRKLDVSLARRAEAEFALGAANVTVRGQPKEGYAFDSGRMVVRPNRVRLSGPRSEVEALQADPSRLRLAPVDLEGRVFEVSQQVSLDRERVDRSVELRTAGGVVEVTIPIQPRPVTRELLAIPVNYVNEDALVQTRRKVAFATPELDLKVTGPRALLDALGNEALLSRIRLQWDWNEARLHQAHEPVRVFTERLPDDLVITDLDGRPPEIEYRLEPLEPAGADATAPGESP